MKFNKNNKVIEFAKLTEHEEFKLKGLFAPRFYYLFIAPVIYLLFIILHRCYTKKLIALKWRKRAFLATLIILSVFILLALFNLIHTPLIIVTGVLYPWLYIFTDINFNILALFNLGSVFVLMLASFNLHYLVGDIYV